MTKVYKRFFEIVTQEKDKLSKQYGVRRIGLFGSSVRGDATEGSDADVLVDFSIKSFDNYMGLKFFLEEHLGVKVDLVITETLKPAIQQNILKEVKYAA